MPILKQINSSLDQLLKRKPSQEDEQDIPAMDDGEESSFEAPAIVKYDSFIDKDSQKRIDDAKAEEKKALAEKAGVKESAVNDDNLKEVNSAIRGAKTAVDQGEDLSQHDIQSVKSFDPARNEPVRETSSEDVDNQSKLMLALGAIAPTLVGYAVGGKRGGAIGAEATGNVAEAIGKHYEEENKQSAKSKESQKDRDTRLEIAKLAYGSKGTGKDKELELKQKELDYKLKELEQKGSLTQAELALKREIEREKIAIAREGLKGKNLLEEEKKKKEAEKEAYAKTVEGKISKLNSTDKTHLNLEKEAFDSIREMQDAFINNKEDRYKVLGDNNYTKALRRFSNAIGRLESGGAIAGRETSTYKAMARSLFDEEQISKDKLNELASVFENRLKTRGFTPEELGLKRFEYKPKQEAPKADAQAQDKPKLDPFIEKTAKENNISYEVAKKLLEKRNAK